MTPKPAERLVLFGRVLTAGGTLPSSRLEIAGGRITALEPADSAADADLVAPADGYLVPGLIDLQVNGAGGADLTSAPDPAAAGAAVARTLARHGVTAFCPTVVSSTEAVVLRTLGGYGPAPHADGAESLGAHVEGPFLDPAHRGVHDPAVLRDASLPELDRWLAVGRPALVTLAPERPGGLAAVERLAQAGVLVSLGHSGATLDDARAAFARGAHMGTHLFNAMPPLHHRQPGLVGALLAEPAAFVGLIADGVHVDPAIVDLVVRAAGPERVVLVSDALAAAGAPPGPTLLGGQTVVSDGRSVRRADGTLAGSALLLDGCLANVRAWLPWLPLAQAVRMATETPARALGSGVAARKGRLAPGYDADVAVLDADWRVVATVVRGRIVWRSPRTHPATTPA